MTRTTSKPPTAKQLAYLRQLAYRAGQTFTTPRTRAQASAEIRRLRQVRPTSRVERQIERDDYASERAARERNCAVPVEIVEVEGYGSTATWSQRS